MQVKSRIFGFGGRWAGGNLTQVLEKGRILRGRVADSQSDQQRKVTKGASELPSLTTGNESNADNHRVIAGYTTFFD